MPARQRPVLSAAIARWATERLGFGQHSTPGALRALVSAAFAASPGLAAVAVAGALVQGLAGTMRYVALGVLVRSLTASPDLLPTALVLLAVVAVAESVLPPALAPVTAEVSRRVDLHFRERLIAAVGGPTTMAHLEDPSMHDLLATAQGIGFPGLNPGGAVQGYLALVSLKARAWASVALLAVYAWWLAAFVALGGVVVRRHILRIWFETQEALNGDVPGLRASAYARDLAMRPEAAKEVRTFGLGDWLVDRHHAAWTTAMRPVWERRRTIGWRMLRIDAAVLLLAGVAATPIAHALANGEIEASQAVVLAGALTAIVGLGGFLPNADFPIRYGCATLPAVAELEERALGERPSASAGSDRPVELRRSVRLEDVSFRYPWRDETVLDGLDLEIEAGTTVAVVGANGVGKTTLIKLLTGLHEPSAGRITVDGVDLRDLDIAGWRRRVAVIFQDFARYEVSARDNVAFGSLGLRDDAAAIEEAARRAGVLDVIEAMPRGWDSPLARSYEGGADLSGGEWQRVALARALLAVRGGAQLLVLDEPTAALDVRTEAEFYDSFLDLTGGTTTILVSHRFSTVRRADRICVLEGGRIAEDGAHHDLVARRGTYARMFELQAGRYADG